VFRSGISHGANRRFLRKRVDMFASATMAHPTTLAPEGQRILAGYGFGAPGLPAAPS